MIVHGINKLFINFQRTKEPAIIFKRLNYHFYAIILLIGAIYAEVVNKP